MEHFDFNNNDLFTKANKRGGRPAKRVSRDIEIIVLKNQKKIVVGRQVKN